MINHEDISGEIEIFNDYTEEQKKKKLENNMGKQMFYQCTQKTFEPSVDRRKKSAQELAKPITTGNEIFGVTNFKRLDNYDERTQKRGNEI